MGADRPHLLGQSVVIGEKRAAFAVTAQRFGREKTRAANRRYSATAPAALRRAKALRAVLDHRQTLRAAIALRRP